MTPRSDAQSNIGSYVDNAEPPAYKRVNGIIQPSAKAPVPIQTQRKANNVAWPVGKRVVSAPISAEAAKALKEDILNTIDEVDKTLERVGGRKRISRVSLPLIPEIGTFVIKKKNGETIVVDSDDEHVRPRRRTTITANSDPRIGNQNVNDAPKQTNVVRKVAPVAAAPKATVAAEDGDADQNDVAAAEPEPPKPVQMTLKSKKQLKREAKQQQKEQEQVNAEPPPKKNPNDVKPGKSNMKGKSKQTKAEGIIQVKDNSKATSTKSAPKVTAQTTPLHSAVSPAPTESVNWKGSKTGSAAVKEADVWMAPALPPTNWEGEGAGKNEVAKAPSVAWTVPAGEAASKQSTKGSQEDSIPPDGSRKGSKAGSHKTVNLPYRVPEWTTLAAAHGWMPSLEAQPPAMYINMPLMPMPPMVPVLYPGSVQQWAAAPPSAPGSQHTTRSKVTASPRRTSFVPTVPVYDPLQAFPAPRSLDSGTIDPLTAFPVPGSLASGPRVIDPTTAFPKPYSLQSQTSLGRSKASKTSKVSHVSKAQTHYSTGLDVDRNTWAPANATLSPPRTCETQTSHYRPATVESATNISSMKRPTSAKTHISVHVHCSRASQQSHRSNATEIKTTRETKDWAMPTTPSEQHAAKPPSTKSAHLHREPPAPSPPPSDNWHAPSVALGESAGSVLYDLPIIPAEASSVKGSHRSKSGSAGKMSSKDARASVNEDMRSQAKTESWNGIPVSVASWREGLGRGNGGGQW
ncbi:hypothetical protein LTS18_003228 [Coniosporium uncinatum]|uniref:Uncharacterized protein n=1 Tax=Coniosporium uncinatum TaxID=93489 RepID=A0ACC3D717_9PEZI|nr:hypothetical protein LTS18_003228 [Coniosporium uncinatum]